MQAQWATASSEPEYRDTIDKKGHEAAWTSIYDSARQLASGAASQHDACGEYGPFVPSSQYCRTKGTVAR